MAKKTGLWILAIIGLIFVFVVVKPNLFSTITSPITTPFVYDDYNFYENFLSGTINHAGDWDIQDGVWKGQLKTRMICKTASDSGVSSDRMIIGNIDSDGCQHWNIKPANYATCTQTNNQPYYLRTGANPHYLYPGCNDPRTDSTSSGFICYSPSHLDCKDYYSSSPCWEYNTCPANTDFGGLKQESYYDGTGFPVSSNGIYSSQGYPANCGVYSGCSNNPTATVRFNHSFGDSDVKIIFSMTSNKAVCDSLAIASFYARINGQNVLLAKNPSGTNNYVMELVRSKVDSNYFAIMLNAVQIGEYSGDDVSFYWALDGVSSSGSGSYCNGQANSQVQIKQIKYKMPFSCRLDADQLNVKMRFNEGSRVDINSFGVKIDKFCLGMPVIQRSYTGSGLQSTAEPYEILARGGSFVIPQGQYWEVFGIVTNDGSLTQCGVDEAIVLTQSTCQTECLVPPCPSIPCGKPSMNCVKVGMTDVQCSMDSQCPVGYDCGSTGFCKAGKSILELEAQVSNLSLEVGYRGELIKNLSGTLTQQTEQLRLLKLSAEENAVIIKNMTKNFEEQTEIIKALRLNATENARLIDEMGGRIEEQGLRLKELNQTVEENAITIGIMTANVQDQKKLILALELNATENGILIANMQLNIRDQLTLIEVLKTSQAEKELMIGQMLTEIQFQTNKINELNGIIEINGAMIASMDANIQEQLAVIELLEISLAEKEVLRIELVNKLNDANAKIAAMQVVVDQLGDDYESARAQILALSATLTNASDRITFLLLTVGELQLNNEEVANLLISYRARLGEDAILLNRLQSQNYNLSLIIHEYGLNLEKEKALVKQLNVSNQVLSEIVKDYEQRLKDQQALTSTLQLQNSNLSVLIARYKDNLLSAEQTIGLLNQKNSDLIMQINKYKANLITEAELVRLLNISNAQLLKDINDYKNNLISEQQLSEKLKVTNAQLLVLVSEYETRLQAIAVYIKNLEKSNADALDIINKLQLSLSEKQDLIDYLNNLGKITHPQPKISWGWIVFGAIIIIGGAYLIFKKK